MKVPYPKNICNVSQGPPNQEFRSVKVHTENFLKRDSQHLKILFDLGSYEHLAILEIIKTQMTQDIYYHFNGCRGQKCEELPPSRC